MLAEINEVLEGRTEVQVNDVSKLVYLEQVELEFIAILFVLCIFTYNLVQSLQVLNETLRLYPILTAGPMKLLEYDITIDADMVIPAKTTIMVCVWGGGEGVDIHGVDVRVCVNVCISVCVCFPHVVDEFSDHKEGRVF